MKLTTFNYHSKSNWSISAFPEVNQAQSILFVFGSSNVNASTKPVKELQARYPRAHFIGCSSSGEIFGTEINDDSLSVALVEFADSKVKSCFKPIVSPQHSYDVGCEISKELLADDLRAIFVLSDGLNINGSQLVAGINQNIPESVLVTGGLAGDAARFEHTWVLSGHGDLASHQVAAIGLYGKQLEIQCSSKGGWDIFGPERCITKSKENIVYEIDGQPALKLYKEYLGERAKDLPASALLFPLTIRSNKNEALETVRTILSVNEADQSLTFAGDVPQGWHAQLMRANYDRLITGASEAALALDLHDNSTPTLSIAISCVGRRLILGERTEEEIEACLEVLPQNTKQVGFYSYGEISPVGTKDCMLHNQTMTLTLIRENSARQ